MHTRFIRLLVVSVVAIAAVFGVTDSAGAAPHTGPGTFTRITSPKSMTFDYDEANPTANTFVVTGSTSADVTSVDIDCIWNNLVTGPQAYTFASSVPVTAGSFSTTATFPNATINCRLRALPSGTTIDDYLGSFSGPVLLDYTFEPETESGVTYGYAALGEQNNGLAVATDAASCGAALVATVQTPSMTLAGTPTEECAFALPGTNVTASGTSTGSAITVDGLNAYLPGAVNSYLNSSQSLGLTQPPLHTRFSRAKNGDLTIVESATLLRCSAANTYPPTTTSCPSLVSTGVTFRRTVDIFRGDHQIRFRDTFTSSGPAHTISLHYEGTVAQEATGSPGFVYPGHGKSVVGAKAGQTVTGLGKKAASVLIRSDRYASSNEPEADTHALTWSAAPSTIQFSSPATTFAMNYSLKIPARGTRSLGFADSENPTSAGVASLARLATDEMVIAPSITSPANGKSIKGNSTTVRGTVIAGANGLPTKVTVNGHRAKLKDGRTKGTWSVTFSESFAKHRITAVATDVAGNSASRSITVTNRK